MRFFLCHSDVQVVAPASVNVRLVIEADRGLFFRVRVNNPTLDFDAGLSKLLYTDVAEPYVGTVVLEPDMTFALKIL
jgi:hypothetical protein